MPITRSTDIPEAEWDKIDRETKDEYLRLVEDADSLLSKCHRRSCEHGKARRKLAFRDISREAVPV
ncbi:hypothetical protein LLH23_08845 [bacterium]|nr:hypothetical protein [bacterium]